MGFGRRLGLESTTMYRFPALSTRILQLGWGLVLCVSAAPLAAMERYALDPVHTRVMLAIDHAGYSQALGTVSGSSGVLAFEPGNWGSARLEARIPLEHIDFGDARWNEAVRARRLLDTGRYPDAVFVSEHVEAIADDRFLVHGHLSLRGTTRPVALDVRFNALKRYPLPPFRRTAGFSATATLSRSDFGIDAWSSLIGDTVELRIEAEAGASRRARFSEEGPAPAGEDEDDDIPDGAPTPDIEIARDDAAGEPPVEPDEATDPDPDDRPHDTGSPLPPPAPSPARQDDIP